MTTNDASDAIFEHRFWLQVLGDHGRFIHDGLSPSEEAEIQKAAYFIDRFDKLLAVAQTSPFSSDLDALHQRALRYAEKFREFKLHLLRRHLVGKVKISLPPTFINHMVNEIEEYLRILNYLCRGQTPPALNPVHHHVLWLQDAVGRAATIHSSVDPVEQNFTSKSQAFRKQFEAYYLKAVELSGYLRTNLNEFPALERFNLEVGLDMKLFKNFLEEIEELRLSDEILGALEPLLPDHMAREECYYLIKLAEVTALESQDCDPTKPRVQR